MKIHGCGHVAEEDTIGLPHFCPMCYAQYMAEREPEIYPYRNRAIDGQESIYQEERNRDGLVARQREKKH